MRLTLTFHGQVRLHFLRACRRLCWVNTDSQQVCDIAILGDSQWLPDASAKVCYQHQRDFNYLEVRHLWEDARVDADGVRLAGMHYRAIILDGLPHLPPQALPRLQQLAAAGRLILWGESPHKDQLAGAQAATSDKQMMAAVDALIAPDVMLEPPTGDIRVRHVIKGNRHLYLLFNEESSIVVARLQVKVKGTKQWWDPATGKVSEDTNNGLIEFAPHEMKLLCIAPAGESTERQLGAVTHRNR